MLQLFNPSPVGDYRQYTIDDVDVLPIGAFTVPEFGPGGLTSIFTGHAPDETVIFQSSMNLTLNAGGTTYTFTQAIEFAPDGEARVSTWNDFVELGIKSSINPQSSNVAVMRLTRLTGKYSVYRQ